MEELRIVEEKWRLIGREFGVRGVDYPDPINCLREVVRRRLQDPYYTSWRHITIALSKAGEPLLADNLKAKYTPGELTTTTSSQYSLESQQRNVYCHIVIEWTITVLGTLG